MQNGYHIFFPFATTVGFSLGSRKPNLTTQTFMYYFSLWENLFIPSDFNINYVKEYILKATSDKYI